MDIKNVEKALALTLHPSYGSIYSTAFSYYNLLAIDRIPEVEKPSDAPEYPPKAGSISHINFIRSFPCWTYPLVTSPETIPPYTVFSLLNLGKTFGALATWSNGDLTAYIGEGFKIKLFTGSSKTMIKKSAIVSIAFDENPYRAVEKVVKRASNILPVKPRKFKKEPMFLKYLGWCSWNALLQMDLNHRNIVKIIRGLVERGVPVKWVIIDDGWQKDIHKGEGWFSRVLADLSADEKKFPDGLARTVEELRKLGIKLVGLWHTINIHWSGFEKTVSDKLGIEGYKNPFTDSYIPPPQFERVVEFYTSFHKWVKSQGFDFVKVDNQWSIHALYQGSYTSAEASRSIQTALQISSQVNGLDILNCMSMVPEDYSNYFASNAMRVSIDYTPFWKADAKLHTLFSVYNSLFFSHIIYPDYDMWMSYDPYAKIHAITRVFSGGPIYITDRHPEKTNINLIKMIVLPDGEIVRVDEPGLPTKDILFRDPYNEKVLLKISSRSRHAYVVALININREGVEIEDVVSLRDIPFKVEDRSYAYYEVFSEKWGIITPKDKVKVTLKELEAEILVFAPVKDGKTVIGLKEYLLPLYPVEVIEGNDKLYIKTRTNGTLIYIKNNTIHQSKVSRGEVVTI